MLKMGLAPHIRRTDKASHMSMDVLITLIPLCVFSTVYYGIRPVLLVLTGMVTAILCETICCLLMRRVPTVTDGTAAVTGGLVGALMSPISPYWLPAAAAVFAIVAVKMPFGGTGRNVFNPAAAGIAVVTLCFDKQLFTYPDPQLNKLISLDMVPQVVSEKSIAAQLHSGGASVYNFITLMLGDFPGPICATAIIVLVACALYLFYRRSASPLITLPYLAVCAACAILYPRITGNWQQSVLLELCSGYLLFCGIFLLNDPVTAPRFWLGRIAYGLFAGILVMSLRYYGRFEAGACFAVLLVNAFAPMIDRGCWHLDRTLRTRFLKKKEGASS